MALFSRKNLNNDHTDGFNEWLDHLFNEVDVCDRIPITEALKKDNYQLAKELYSISNYKEYKEYEE